MVAQEPKGSVPETKKDVKSTVNSSDTEADIETKSTVDSDSDESVSIDESDLASLKESKKIPYNRFKEVNDKAKTLESQLQALERSKQSELQRAIEDAELRIRAQVEREKGEMSIFDESEPWERGTSELQKQIETLQNEISSLKSSQNESALQSDMNRLKSEYPEADTLSVLGWKRSNPTASLDELMALSHTRNVETAEKMIAKIIEEKKKRAKGQSVVSTYPERFRLPEGEKPKTLKEATAKAKKFLNGL